MLQRACFKSPFSSCSVLRRIAPCLCDTFWTRRSLSSEADTDYSASDTDNSFSSVSLPRSLECSDDEDLVRTLSPQSQVLRAYLRSFRGRNLSRIRENGLIPASLQDPSQSRLPSAGKSDVGLALEAQPVYTLLKMFGKREFLSHIFELEIFSRPPQSELKEKLRIIPRNLSYGPGKTNIFNIQLLRAPPGKIMTLGVPLEFFGKEHCPGLQKGGVLKTFAKFVLYNCQASELPAKIVVDTTVLEIGDRVLVRDLEVDFKLLHSDRLMPVCEIVRDAATMKARAKQKKKELIFTNLARGERNGCKEEAGIIMVDDELKEEMKFASSKTVRNAHMEGVKGALLKQPSVPRASKPQIRRSGSSVKRKRVTLAQSKPRI